MAAPLSRATAALLLLQLHNAGAQNMNGGQYKIANAGAFSSDFKAEYFEVYSPVIRSQYSEVYWKMQEPVPLPSDIQKRFKNKVMAVVGYEVDQVRKTPSGDVQVPITWAYNHHYCAWLHGSKTELVKTKGIQPGLNHGSDEYWKAIVAEDPNPTSEIPLSQFFSEANGGEFRKSYHGYPQGYAQLIESPDTFRINPMQIDSWNREMVGAKFMPGPLPKKSRIPESAGYSGLIECPCSDRLKIEWEMTYGLETSGNCEAPVQNASECFAGARQVVQAENYFEKVISDKESPPGCAVKPNGNGIADIIWNSNKINPTLRTNFEGSQVVAYSHAQVNLTVALDPEGAIITMVGPADKWFGVGFGANSMCVHLEADECSSGGPYTIVAVGEDVVERKLDYHGPGTVLEPSANVEKNFVDDGVRTVVVRRPLKGVTIDHYTFDPSVASIPIIAAKGCDLTFAQHCGHGPSELNFLPAGVSTGICQAGIHGTIGGNKFNNKRCAPFPTSDLVAQHNPTCSVQTYRGGLSCCRHEQSLLDLEQENPWPGQYLEYHLKFRFYFEEYHDDAPQRDEEPSHKNLIRLYWQTEGHAGEYDIVQCAESVPSSQCIQEITSRWKVRDMVYDCSTRPDGSGCSGKGSTDSEVTEGIEIIYAGPHCHAPTCLSMELYNADTGQLLCRMQPTRGLGKPTDLYDESGFLAIPPCLWGDASEGLPPPVLLPLDTTLLSIKRNNNTLGHTGEMASWQMRGVVVSKKKAPSIEVNVIEASSQITSTNEKRGRLRRAERGTA